MIESFRKHIICKVIAFTACLIFVWQSIGPTGEARAQDAKTLLSTEIKLPARFGEVIDLFKGNLNKTVIHIRDAHCDYSAQNSISGIIGYFRDTYGVDLVALEGGSGDYDLSVFTDIKDVELREKVADYFVRQGEVSGAEFYAINNPEKVTLYGIEEPALYVENLKAYRDSLKFKDKALVILKSMAEKISKQKDRIYPSDFRELDKKIRFFKEDKIGFEEYAAAIAAYAEKHNIDMSEYPNVTRFYDVMDHENGINMKEAERERNILIDLLNKRLSKKYLEELVAKTVEFNDGNMPAEEYYAHLLSRAELCGIDLDKMQNLLKYAETAKKTKTMNKKALEKEFKALEEKIYASFLKTDEERALCVLDKKIFMLDRLFSAGLVKDDWDYYIAHRNDFQAKEFVSLNGYRLDMEKFYDLSLKRDDCFINNIAGKLKEEKQKNIILVTGGFHQDNLKKLFQDKGYSYVEVLPKMEKRDGKNPYFQLLSGGADPIMRAVSERQSSLQIASYLSTELKVQDEEAFRSAVKIVEQLIAEGRSEPIAGRVFSLSPDDGEMLKVNSEQVLVSNRLVYVSKPIPAPGAETVKPLVPKAPAAEEKPKLPPEVAIAEEERADTTRRAAVDRIVNAINDYRDLKNRVAEVIRKIEQGAELTEEDAELLKDLRRRLEARNSLVALSRKVQVGDRIVTFSQQNIKFLNSKLSAPQNDEVIRERQRVLAKLLIGYGLIKTKGDGTLLVSYKQDKFVIGRNVIKRFGNEEVIRRLNAVSKELAEIMNTYIESKDKELKSAFGAYYGLSEIVSAPADDLRILADMQALQAAKIARRKAEEGQSIYGDLFSQKDFDGLVKTAQGIRSSLGLMRGEMPSLAEMEAVRGKPENQLTGRNKNIKKYLDIIDLFDYPKDWPANPELRNAQKDRILELLKLLENIRPRAPPPQGAAKYVLDALSVLETNTKNPEITSGAAFHYYAFTESIKNPKDPNKMGFGDVMGFWASIQKNLAEACQNYSDGANVVSESLAADDKVKVMMKENVDKLIDLLGDSILKTASGKMIIYQEGGDEIAFFVPAAFDLSNFANALADDELKLRLMASEINYGNTDRRPDTAFALTYTEVAHGPYGEAYVSAQESDKMAKYLEKLKLRAVVSEEISDKKETEWFAYYREGDAIVRKNYKDVATINPAASAVSYSGTSPAATVAAPVVAETTYAKMVDEMPNKIKVTGEILNSIFRGKEYRVIVSGAEPTDDKGNVDIKFAASGKLIGEKNAANRYLNEELNMGIYLAHTAGVEAAKREIKKIVKEAPKPEQVSYMISAYLLGQLERDDAFKRELGLKEGDSLESFLRQLTTLDVIVDFKENVVYLMPYFEATAVGLSRLNLIDLIPNIIKRIGPEADLTKDEEYIKAYENFCRAVSLLSGQDYSEQFAKTMKGKDPLFFFKTYDIKLLIPPVAPIDLNDMQRAVDAMKEVWRSL